ncbi:transposase [Mangrovicoccus ximenensis]|uniref:transposase n=1 Tax=Mangrovicoccus ximenensis TaxID=1911570 RepID=UPI000D39EFF6|nr:transposase [Mangrovicoccus ximenensis]
MSRTVWGFTVTRSKSGRNIWPPELKREAARRMLDDGLPPVDIAREIGANDCMLRDWLKDDRVRRASVRHASAGFAEVSVEDAEPALPRPADPVPDQAAPIAISIGDLRMEAVCTA